jgi:stage III sporulation protein AG
LPNKKGNNGRFILDKLFAYLGLQKLPAKERKMILTLFLLAGMGIGFMFWGGSGPPKSAGNAPELSAKGLALMEKADERWSESRLEREVAAILAQIKGVGRVAVDLHLATTEETQWLYREERQERVPPAEQGKNSNDLMLRREPVFQRKSGGTEVPVSSGQKAPVISGVLVVAEGAADPAIRQQLGEATAVLLGIALHRVIVLPWG